MDFRYAIKRRFLRLPAPAIGTLVVIYFGYHVVQGEKGVIAYAQLASEVARVEASLAVRRAERARLEAKVALLGGDQLDADFLDEQVRRFLGLAHPDEVVVFTN